MDTPGHTVDFEQKRTVCPGVSHTPDKCSALGRSFMWLFHVNLFGAISIAGYNL